jgi:1-acyl-sn-glycerol-3-phosphate acyltransferase
MTLKSIRFLRAATRITALCLLSAVAALLYLFVSLSPETKRKKNWQCKIKQLWAKGVARIVKIKLKIEGEPPNAPFFLVANHLSYVDIIALMARLDCVFIAKSEIANWPFIGSLARMTGTVFVDRKQRRGILPTLDQIDSALKNQTGVVLFAEGTSTKGENVLPFKPSLLEIAARSALPVHYASLSYVVPGTETPASLSICWWGDMNFHGHIWRFCQLSECEAVIRFGPQPLQERDRKELAKKLWKAVNEKFIPVV